MGDTLDIGLRLEDFKLDWSLSADSSVKVSVSRDSGAGLGLLRRFLVKLSPDPRTLTFLQKKYKWNIQVEKKSLKMKQFYLVSRLICWGLGVYPESLREEVACLDPPWWLGDLQREDGGGDEEDMVLVLGLQPAEVLEVRALGKCCWEDRFSSLKFRTLPVL